MAIGSVNFALVESSMQLARLVMIVLAGATMSACNSKPDGELDWARSALERNPQIKVLAVDTEKNTIQVRVKGTGEVVTLTPGELAAIPIGDLLAQANNANAAPANTSASEPRTENSTTAAATPTSPTEVVSAEAKVEPAETPSEPSEGAEPQVGNKPAYTVHREDGKVRVTGPGISIESNQSAPQTNAADAHFNEPIICDGKRLLHLDNKRLKVAGDAVIARGGCELHITNSFITASGTGVIVQDATVHITNSEITGGESSLTTNSGARVLYRNSKFNGLARRDANATIQDQGGNTWR
jgi:hypothetical protein